MPVDADLFRDVLGRFATGVAIVTLRDHEGRDHGMTVSAFSSLSLDPPLVLICIGNDATMSSAMQSTESFSVNILSTSQEALSRRFADKLDDRFLDIAGARSAQGNMILDGAVGTLDCRVVARHPAGDHVIVVGAVEAAAAHHESPLLYYRGEYARLQR